MGEANKKRNPLLVPFVLLGLYGQICVQQTNAGKAVEYLPGFEGPLPFQLETGYVGVDEGEDLQVFYYLTNSESIPEKDPLLFWFTGGPGCSALSALLYEIGPLMFKGIEYYGSLPTLIYNPNSWTKLASIVYIDLPCGTGFTYTKSGEAPYCTDLQLFDHGYEFITKWLMDHPEFSYNPIYLGGDSYAGIPVPIIAQLITNGNEAGTQQFINLKGYVLGNAATNVHFERTYHLEFARGLGLIPDDLYDSMKVNCKGEYRKDYIDPTNLPCLRDSKAFDECIEGLQMGNIMDPECGFYPPVPSISAKIRSALDERIDDAKVSLFASQYECIEGLGTCNIHKSECGITKRSALDDETIDEISNAKVSHSAPQCQHDANKLCFYWANDISVRDALHIRKGSIGEWKRCHRDTLTMTIWDVRSYHANLSNKGYRSLIYSGDHDMLITHQSTQAWIKDLNYSIIDQWRSWKHKGQVAGYTRTYSNNMTFATIKGGGHIASETKPGECFSMFERWISHEPL